MDAALRRDVIERAGHRCEYCWLPQKYQSGVPFHVEHIVATQHRRDNSLGNLALACHRCNLHKGTNLTGLDPATGTLTRLFHPRQDIWTEHFVFENAEIVGLTAIGRTTVSLLQMNARQRIDLRLEIIAAGGNL